MLDAMTIEEGLRPDQRDSVLMHASREKRVGMFLDQLETCGKQAFSLFMNALGENQSHLYGVLLETCRTIDDADQWERSTMTGEAMRRLLVNSNKHRALTDTEGGEVFIGGYRNEEFNNSLIDNSHTPCFTVATK